jgi:hypothetical protein
MAIVDAILTALPDAIVTAEPNVGDPGFSRVFWGEDPRQSWWQPDQSRAWPINRRTAMTANVSTPQPVRRRRSIAWVYYAILALVGVFASFTAPGVLVLTLACAAYSAYLFRGGRFVLWIW